MIFQIIQNFLRFSPWPRGKQVGNFYLFAAQLDLVKGRAECSDSKFTVEMSSLFHFFVEKKTLRWQNHVTHEALMSSLLQMAKSCDPSIDASTYVLFAANCVFAFQTSPKF